MSFTVCWHSCASGGVPTVPTAFASSFQWIHWKVRWKATWMSRHPSPPNPPSHYHTGRRSPWKLRRVQIFKKETALCTTRKLITVFAWTLYLFVCEPSDSSTHPLASHLCKICFNIISLSMLTSESGPFPSDLSSYHKRSAVLRHKVGHQVVREIYTFKVRVQNKDGGCVLAPSSCTHWPDHVIS